MKKKLLFIPLISLIALPGCGSTENKNKKGDVVNALVLKANTKAIKKNIFSSFELAANFSSNDGTTYSVSNGFTIITKDNKRSFYSAILNQKVAEISSSDTYTTYYSDVAGGFLAYTTSEGTTIMDGIGNVLFDKSNRTYETLSISSGINSKDIYYCDVKFDNTSYYYHYDESGVATMHATNMGDDYGSGSVLPGINYILLDDFGHPGYQLIKNSSRFIVFNSKGNEISSFTDPNGDALFFVGDYLIYQNSVKLDDNNNNYDFISETGERYSLETYRINYLNAKKEAISVQYLLSKDSDAIHSFRNSKGIYTYAYADLKTISDKKILSNTKETYIIDASGNLHDNVTGINLGAFERLGNNFYNTDSKTIYDGNLNELSILTNMNPIKVDNASIIVCQVEGKYGALNQNGKVVLPFEYDYIYTDYISDTKALVTEDGTKKVVAFDTEELTHQDSIVLDGNQVEYYGIGVYKIDNVYFCLANLEPFLIQNEGVQIYYAVSNAINIARVFTLETAEEQVTYYSGSISISTR